MTITHMLDGSVVEKLATGAVSGVFVSEFCEVFSVARSVSDESGVVSCLGALACCSLALRARTPSSSVRHMIPIILPVRLFIRSERCFETCTIPAS